MRDNTQAFMILASGTGTDRLSADEITTLFDYCYTIHDHKATTPQPILYWWRVPRPWMSKYGAN